MIPSPVEADTRPTVMTSTATMAAITVKAASVAIQRLT
jgi:hypothetical protein